ncbi:uncharacterized protein LOC113329894 isoform X3 [Papaver somniferum]|uniref:uncharacterized protein LOC113329894 isoform X3 n=1 Tax=Papaver somniferum TaxID=3469 RepID=UPI000E6F5C16|nr:uncharacterized protein LOC113329894 isoform X3 [Papaver somniferum]
MSRSPGNQNRNERPNSKAPETAELQRHLPLYRAAKKGDWQKANNHIVNNRDAVTARITISNDTALHIAAAQGHVKFVKELVNLMTCKQLELENSDGETALQGAVLAGNIESVKAMVEKNPKLTLLPDRYQYIPLLNAANYAPPKEQKKDIVEYLYTITSDNDDEEIFSGDSGRQIICSVIGAGFHDIAKDMIEKYEDLAIQNDSRRMNPCALDMMAASKAFLRRDELQFWDRLIYSLHFPSATPGISFKGDAENPPESSSFPYSTRVCGWISEEIRKLAKQVVPGIKIHNKKLMHDNAVALTKCIITKMKSLKNSSEIEEYFTETGVLDVATKLGAVEVVMECLQSFPGLHWVKMGEDERDMFYSAVCARQEKIFNLVYQIHGFKKKLAASLDKQGSTILHMVAWTQSESPFVSSVYCVALRLQRDLQWFQLLQFLGAIMVATIKITKETQFSYTRSHS